MTAISVGKTFVIWDLKVKTNWVSLDTYSLGKLRMLNFNLNILGELVLYLG